jgi:iron complex transport system ATP-binding protein
MIHLKNCTIGYTNPLFSLDEIQLLKGEIYALIGSNGAGKSTFFATITQQTKLLNGSITIDQQPLNKFSKNSLAKQIAFVESTSDLPDFLTVREYLALGRTPFTNTLGRLTSLDIEQINKIVGVLDLAPYLSKFMLNLSDGERQIMAIGRALVQDTPLIILDEPTAFLDYGNRKKIIQLLKLLAKKENKCILFSSHDIELCLDEVQQLLYIDFEEKKLISTGNITKELLIQKAFSL